jgi:hypothetical protein
MATINIKYNPSISVFFNSDGKLVIGDVNGDYGNGNENGWGGYNPPKSSITVANFVIVNQATGDAYLLTGGSDTYDLLADGFYDTTSQLLIEADIYTDILNILTFVQRDNDSSQFEQGIYTLSFALQGTYTFAGDTINWQSDNYSETPLYVSNAVNLNSSCIETILRKISFSKNCKLNKKFSNLNMYLNMNFEFQNYIAFQPVGNDYRQRIVRVNDIFQEIQGLCNGKNNCKC